MIESYKISILTPSYNSADYIERAILSVLNQSYSNFEHIIVDGGSTDGTIEILKKYPHLKWISEKDKGQSDAMNKAFIMSSGDIIAYLNSDDWFETNSFNVISNTFLSNPEIDMVVGKIKVCFADNTYYYTDSNYTYEKIRLHFFYGFPNNPVGYFYKREIQEKIGEFPINNHFSMDYWFLLNSYKKFNVYSIEFILGNYYLSGFNKTSKINPVIECKKTFLKFAFSNDHIGLLKYIYKYYLEFKWKKVFQ